MQRYLSVAHLPLNHHSLLLNFDSGKRTAVHWILMGFQLCSLKNSTFKTILSTFFKVNICFFQKHFSLLVFQTCYRYLRSFFLYLSVDTSLNCLCMKYFVV